MSDMEEKLFIIFVAWFVVILSVVIGMAVIAQFHDWGVWK